MIKKLLIALISLFSLGNLMASEPTIAPSNIAVGTIQCNQAVVSWTNGNGGWRLIVVKEASAVNVTPTDGTAYTAFAILGNGDNLGSSNFACWNNINNNFTLKGLKPNTKYYIAVFEHDGLASPNYLTSSYATASFTTQNLIIDFSFVVSKDSCDKTNVVTFTNKSSATYTGVTYSWLFADATSGSGTNVTHTYMKGGNFLVTLIASPALGCTDFFTSTKAVFIIPRPISKPIEKNNKLSQCLEGNYFQFDDQTTLAKIPKCAYTRTWYFTASDSATIPTPNKTYTTAGTYRILYKSETYYDNNRTGCTDTASLIINVIPDPSSGVSINNSIQCFKGNSFKFDNTYPGLSSWFWDLGDGTTTNTKSITHAYASVGNYQIIHEAQSPVGCKSRDTSYVYVKPNTDAKFTGLSGAVCEGGASISLTPGTPGGVFTTSSGTIVGTSYTPGKAGIQIVKYVTRDSFCPDSTTQTIKINALPKFSLGKDTTICDGSTTDLLIPIAGNVLWDDGSNNNPRTISNSGKYFAQVDNNGCKWSDTINIAEKTTPQVTLPGDTLICKGSILQLTASWPGATITWSTGYTGNSIYVANSGIYTVTATNACGSASDQIEVTLASGFCDVFIPDAFTPNGDGRNDSFEIIGRDVNAVFLNIYNRWGEKIFDSHDANSFKWSGYYKGDVCPEGLYTFIYRYEQKVGDRVRRATVNGGIMLLR